MSVNPVPEGYRSVNAYLIVEDAAKAIEFYGNAFGAEEIYRLPMKDADGRDKIGHAEIRIGDSTIMLSDAMPEMGHQSPTALGGSPVGLMLYVADVDKVFDRAIGAGGKVRTAVQDQFYGDRSGNLVDPFGHLWTVSTHVEDVAPDEMQRRFHEMMASYGKA